MTSVAVVGGGITGLAAARQLTLAGARVTVLEGSGSWGGKLDRTTVEDVELDTGAESMLARRPEALTLVDALRMGGRLVHPTPAKPMGSAARARRRRDPS